MRRVTKVVPKLEEWKEMNREVYGQASLIYNVTIQTSMVTVLQYPRFRMSVQTLIVYVLMEYP
jgi:hypothetical protein